ncbi:MAG: transposase [Gammaproteobacteria bacterium]|nr:transposase [Gammaproteobacteria bacterium]
MPRNAHVTQPYCPHHVVLCTHNRRTVFDRDDDFRHCLLNLKQWKRTLGIKVFAYCLLSHRLELIVDPGAEFRNLEKLMGEIAERQPRRANHTNGRGPKLWEMTYAVSRIGGNGELSDYMRYVELSPVRACLVANPGNYRWSSYQTKVGKAKVGWLDFDPGYVELDRTAKGRASRYRDFVSEGLSELERSILTKAIAKGCIQ